MKTTIKKYFPHITIFLGGLILGAIIMGYLSMRASKTYLEVFRSHYIQEQLESAAQARRQGDKYAEYVHRSNAVEILPMGKIKAFENTRPIWTIGFPFAAPILDRMVGNIEKGRRMNYAIELGRLADATENLGMIEEAEKLWTQAVKLAGRDDINKFRLLISNLNVMDETILNR